MKHPNHPSVDQSDRVVPYNLRQSGRTPDDLDESLLFSPFIL